MKKSNQQSTNNWCVLNDDDTAPMWFENKTQRLKKPNHKLKLWVERNEKERCKNKVEIVLIPNKANAQRSRRESSEQSE